MTDELKNLFSVVARAFDSENYYSTLNAFMGEIPAARRAGIMAAKNAQTARAPAATPNANGSQKVTP
jgi:hypothetical protein